METKTKGLTTFEKKLTDILKKNTRFIDKNGDLIKSEIISSSTKIDEDLISEKELIYTENIDEEYIRINKIINLNNNSLNEPYNTITAQKMSDLEIENLINDYNG